MSDLLLDVLPWSLIGPTRGQKIYVVALAMLAASSLLALAALQVARLEVVAGAFAGAAVAAWLLSNGPGEGGTLLVVFPGNGLTLADLAAVPAAVLVLVLSVRRACAPDDRGRPGPSRWRGTRPGARSHADSRDGTA